MLRCDRDAEIDVAQGIAGAARETPAYPERNHVVIAPEKRSYFGNGGALGQLWQPLQAQIVGHVFWSLMATARLLRSYRSLWFPTTSGSRQPAPAAR